MPKDKEKVKTLETTSALEKKVKFLKKTIQFHLHFREYFKKDQSLLARKFKWSFGSRKDMQTNKNSMQCTVFG